MNTIAHTSSHISTYTGSRRVKRQYRTRVYPRKTQIPAKSSVANLPLSSWSYASHMVSPIESIDNLPYSDDLCGAGIPLTILSAPVVCNPSLSSCPDGNRYRIRTTTVTLVLPCRIRVSNVREIGSIVLLSEYIAHYR